ncbi:MAG TPA: NADH-quinone oxidoreductase subunit L [Actinophytocola sp.]|uniref:NADH-quinone oxidoreductase subunit 5 family protein n=1 Tax=Actinophytocola sp. TaxID=1872138 RepID=UPI002DB8A976|nr:NADH-quinone oxidoreductase subunit L [Actinophytocola sp.]HEU5471872.1 NADH-quinone oxidoreductase subunit L [Actinophytocola sp.]
MTVGTLAALAVLAPFAAAALGLPLGRVLSASALALSGTFLAAALGILVASFAAAAPARVWETAAVLTPTGTIPVTLGVLVDGLSGTVAVMVALVALAVQMYSVGYLRHDPRYPSYAALVSLFTAAMLTVVLAADLLVVYAGWEVMGICSYLLIGHRWERQANSAAAVKSFLMTRFGDVGFLFGIFVLGVAAGSFRISDVLAAVPELPAGTLLAATLLLVAGVVGRSAQFPLHTWLPDAMAGPAPVSALIHAATMVAAGVYVVARLFPAFEAAPVSLNVLAVLAVVSMVGAALAALTAGDLKRVLAYSTISQVSLMFAALAIGARVPAVGHLLSHAAFKALLFLCAGAVIMMVGSSLLTDLGGLREVMPVTFVTMTIGFAALAGLPPTSGFFIKDALVTAAEQAARGGPAPVGAATAVLVLGALLLTGLLTGAYVTRAWLLTFFGPPRARFQPVHPEAPPVMTLPLLALAVPALLLGFGGLNWETLRPQRDSALLSVLLAGIGVVAAYAGWRADPVRDPAVALGRLRGLFATALHTNDLYERTVARAVRRLATVVAGVDDRVVGRAVTGVGRGARRLGGVIRLTQNGNPQFYLTGLLAGVLLLAVGVVLLT